MRFRAAFPLIITVCWGGFAAFGCAQPFAYQSRSSPHVAVQTQPHLAAPTSVPVSSDEDLPPISPKTSPGKMTLDACLKLGFQHQPALDAARASLSAAHSGKRALDRLIIPRLFVRDLPVRRQQACVGITIAEAGLTQAEWETRYSITRNFFTVQYIEMQRKVIDEVLNNLITSRNKAEDLFQKGDPNLKISKLDLKTLDIAIAEVRAKEAAVRNGRDKALAALREAIGLAYDYPLELAPTALPQAVYPVKGFVDARVYDDKGNFTGKTKKEPATEYRRLYQIDKKQMIEAAIANRGEMIQAESAKRVTDLEIQAQSRIRGWKGATFAMGSDVHAKQVPQGIFNNDYRPGAFALEMPPLLAGRKADREARAADFAQRAAAVVDKAYNLVSLDVEAQYLKWQEAVEDIELHQAIVKMASDLPAEVQKLQPKDFTSQAVIQANITAIRIRTQLNEELHTHALALAGLERATAGAFRIYPIPAVPTAKAK